MMLDDVRAKLCAIFPLLLTAFVSLRAHKEKLACLRFCLAAQYKIARRARSRFCRRSASGIVRVFLLVVGFVLGACWLRTSERTRRKGYKSHLHNILAYMILSLSN